MLHQLAIETVRTVKVALPNNGELAARLLLAAALGALVGLEREMHDHPAGLRTHMSVSLGACLFGVVSAYGFREFITPADASTYSVDVTRVAAQIVSGVGFLGGGAILKEGASVRGLTTAASLWVSAAVGLASALGMYTLTLTATVILLAGLVFMRRPRRWIRSNYSVTHEQVVVVMKGESDPSHVLAAISAISGIQVRGLRVRDRDDQRVVDADVKADPGVRVGDAIEHIRTLEGVQSVDLA